MINREEQLLHEIKHKEIDARDAIELINELEIYDLLPDVAINLELNKADRDYLIGFLNKTSQRIIPPMIYKLEDEDEIEYFIQKVSQQFLLKQLVNEFIVSDLDRNKVLLYLRPVIKQLAGKELVYLKFISNIIERAGEIPFRDFDYFLSKTSSKDIANIISDKAFVIDNDNMKQAFEYTIKIKDKNPAAHGLIINAIDINRDIKKWSFIEEFDNYMYDYTGRDKYLPKAAKDIFIF